MNIIIIFYGCCIRKLEIIKYKIRHRIYNFRINLYNRLNYKSEYIL